MLRTDVSAVNGSAAGRDGGPAVTLGGPAADALPIAYGWPQYPRQPAQIAASIRCRREAAIPGTTDGQAPRLLSSPPPGAVRPGPARPLAPPRWRRVFPGQEAELRQVRYWLGELLPDCPARGDVVTVTIELAANAIRHSASGLGGSFAVELSWLAHPATVRVAVADAGGLRGPQSAPGGGLAALLGTGPLPVIPPQASAPTGARLTAAAAGPAAGPDEVGTGFVSAGYLANGPLGAGPPEPELAVPDLARPALPEHGRGLRLVAALAERAGVVGDHRGRLVWADVRWADDGTAAEPGGLDGYTEALRDIQTVLAARYPEVNIWFGRATMQWWAMAPEPGPGWLLTAESPLDLAQLLDVYRVTQRPPARRRSRGRHGLTGHRPGPPAGQPPRGSWLSVARAPRRIQQARVLVSSPGRPADR